MNKLLIISVLLLQSCAYKDATLKVNHNASEKFRGPIAQASSISFVPARLIDNRKDKARIGWKQNGFGSNTADITTEEPVEIIISNAISTGLKSNGHEMINNGSIRIEGEVNRFWFEMDVNFWTIEFTGDIQCKLTFIDTKTNNIIYTSVYSGTYSEKKGSGMKKRWQTVMSKAVDNLIDDLVFDEDLAEALVNIRK